jgi:hypothetical protein
MVIKWSPFSAAHSALALNAGKNIAVCQLGAGLDSFFEMGSGCVNTLMAFTVFASIVQLKHEDMKYEKNPWYLRSFVIVFWTWAIFWGFEPSFAQIQLIGHCAAGAYGTVVARLAGWALMITLQIGFLAPALHKYLKITELATQVSSRNERKGRKIALLYARFIAIIVMQLVSRLGSIWHPAQGLISPVPAINLKTTSFLTPLSMGINALIVLFGNRQLRKWIIRKYYMLRGIEQSDSKNMTSMVSLQKALSNNSTTQPTSGGVTSDGMTSNGDSPRETNDANGTVRVPVADEEDGVV